MKIFAAKLFFVMALVIIGDVAQQNICFAQAELAAVAAASNKYGLVLWASTALGTCGFTSFGGAVKYGPMHFFEDKEKTKIERKETGRDSIFSMTKKPTASGSKEEYDSTLTHVYRHFSDTKHTKYLLTLNLSVGYQQIGLRDLGNESLSGIYNSGGVYLGVFGSYRKLAIEDDNDDEILRPYFGFSVTLLGEQTVSTKFDGTIIDSAKKEIDVVDMPLQSYFPKAQLYQGHLGIVILKHLMVALNYNALTFENITSKDKEEKDVGSNEKYKTRPPVTINRDNLSIVLGFNYSF